MYTGMCLLGIALVEMAMVVLLFKCANNYNDLMVGKNQSWTDKVKWLGQDGLIYHKVFP